MEKQISIIIPTYNMEKYIGKCLDSLLIPEFDQVEVWVVNDGSKDRSSEIAHEYADRYPGSIRVIDKENGNYGSCINVALPQCTGRYVKVLDADDTFDTDAFSEFVNLLPECDEDAIITNYATIDSFGKVIETTQFVDNKIVNITLSIRDVLDKVMDSYIQMHRIAYNRSVFDKFVYSQTEGVSYTDIQWAIVPMAHCSSFRCVDIVVYKYLLGREGQTMSDTQRLKGMSHLFKSLEDLTKYYQIFEGETQEYELFRKMVNFQHVGTYFLVLGYLSPTVMNMLREYDLKLNTFAPDIYENINTINYSSGVKYKIFKDIRRKNYPNDFKIPFIVNAYMGLRARLIH